MGKRIAMVAYTHYTTDARPRRAAETLAARGDRVEFFGLTEPEAPAAESIRGVDLVRLPSPRYRGGSLMRYLAAYVDFFVRVTSEVTRRHLGERYDVVYVHTMPDFMVFCAGLARLAGAKVVLDVHDTMPELYQSKFDIAAGHPLTRLLAAQEQLSCRFAHRIICVHEPHRQLLLSRGADPAAVTVIMNLPDPAIFGRPVDPRAAVESSPPRVVYHGTITGRLGIDGALVAFRRLLDRLPEARFDIYGSGDFSQAVVDLIAALELKESVYFSNAHFRVDLVPELIRGASVGVVPNRQDPATAFMLPVKMLEYVYLGIPVVAPRLDAIQHYFDDGAVAYYEPGDVKGLAATLEEVLRSKGRRDELRAGAARFVRQYAWDKMKNDLFAVIDS